MLDDRNQAAGADDAGHLCEEGRPIGRWDVMHDSDREGCVEAAGGIGEPFAVIDVVVNMRIGRPGFFNDGSSDVNSRKLQIGLGGRK